MIKRIVIVFICIGFYTNLTAQRFTFEKTDDGIMLLENGKKIYHFQTKTKSLNGLFPRANYVHPLYGFNEEVLTEDFPEDHPHQRGIFWTWHQVYVNNFRVGDGWDCRNISWQVSNIVMAPKKDTAILKTICYRNSDSLNGRKAQPERFLQEECVLRYYSTATDTRVFSFQLTFTALNDTVKLGASEDEKHYSGFSARFALPTDVTFFAGKNDITPQLLGNIAGKQVMMKGSFGETKDLTVIFKSDTENDAGQQKWILRKEKSMQNIAWPGNRSLIIIRPGESVTVTYKLILMQNKDK